MHSTSDTYDMFLIPFNLRREESVVQIGDALRRLTAVFDDIMLRINGKLDSNEKRLADLLNRINIADEKVKSLNNPKKAVIVYSANKYPGADIHKTAIKCLFSNARDFKFTRSKARIVSDMQPEIQLDKLHFYHVKKPKRKEELKTYGDDIPYYLHYISNLPNFPRSISSLKDDFDFDSDSDVDEVEVVLCSNEETPSAPKEKSEWLLRNYRTELENVPNIDMPEDLPDLPGVVDDVRYNLEAGPAIGPSSDLFYGDSESKSSGAAKREQVSEPIQEKPQDSTRTIDQTPVPSTSKVNISHPSPDKEENKSVKIAEAEPVDVGDKPTEASKSSEKESIEINPQQANEANESKVSRNAPPNVSGDGGDFHASLMEAIRKAGGSKNLKSREPTPKESSSNDLMDDLRSKLLSRRKCIAGNPIAAELSARIPVQTHESSSADTDDTGWEDD